MRRHLIFSACTLAVIGVSIPASTSDRSPFRVSFPSPADNRSTFDRDHLTLSPDDRRPNSDRPMNPFPWSDSDSDELEDGPLILPDWLHFDEAEPANSLTPPSHQSNIAQYRLVDSPTYHSHWFDFGDDETDDSSTEEDSPGPFSPLVIPWLRGQPPKSSRNSPSQPSLYSRDSKSSQDSESSQYSQSSRDSIPKNKRHPRRALVNKYGANR